MHRCLRVPEMLDMICLYLNPSLCTSDSESGYDFYPFRHLAEVARTCRTFCGPALDHLWRSAILAQLLVGCMPSDLWAVEKAEWPGDSNTVIGRGFAFTPRASKLSAVVLTPPGFCDWSLSHIFPALSVAIPEALFPNLQTLSWKQRPEEFHCIQLFLHPRLKSIDFKLHSASSTSLLSTLATKCPNLTELSIESVDFTQHISELVCRLHFLEKITVFSLASDALTHVSRLPNLSSLQLEALPAKLQVSFRFGTTFPTLGTLELTHPDIGPTTEFLRLCSAAPLKKFRASFAEFVTAAKMHKLFVAMTVAFSHWTLEELSLDTECPKSGSDPTIHLIPHHLIRPLLCFTSLTVFSVMSPIGFTLDNEAISEFARALPQIVTFKLLARHPDMSHPPGPTLECLHSFARRCPHLSVLGLALNGDKSVSAVDLSKVQDGVLHQSLVSLDVGHSPIWNVIAVARFLSIVFPNLRTISTEREDAERYDEFDEGPEWPEDLKRYRRWIEVQVTIPAISRTGGGEDTGEAVVELVKQRRSACFDFL
ncbi:hypothetical protein B0H16DRAFT_1777547 [Mycena metata]|uniref:F-box domain-containing protein n=1 Tax=Mycena metata TaxID=1033252 RepID=A0AAD7HU69_9AGAR|nr:hypothetical protein B0H16DRAFT_1777547 [Mycena metata]